MLQVAVRGVEATEVEATEAVVEEGAQVTLTEVVARELAMKDLGRKVVLPSEKSPEIATNGVRGEMLGGRLRENPDRKALPKLRDRQDRQDRPTQAALRVGPRERDS